MAQHKRISALKTFQRAARGQTKQGILSIFLNFVFDENDICDSGSLYLISKDRKRLRPYKLHLPGSRESTDGPGFSDERPGLAWKTYLTQDTQVVNDISSDKNFLSASDDPVRVQNIVCVPIELPDRTRDRTVGVASFHNDDPERAFEVEDVEMIETYVGMLGYALATSKSPLFASEKIFIVHGHDTDLVDQLKLRLRVLGIPERDIVVLKECESGNKTIIEHLEEQVQDCIAGFVLLTPDDVGGKRVSPGGEVSLRPRARQNVIFEAGMLCEKWRRDGYVRFVLRAEPGSDALEAPSDLNGLKHIAYNPNQFEQQIQQVLKEWGFPAGEPDQG